MSNRPDDVDVFDVSAQGKAAWVTWQLASGKLLTTVAVADKFGMTWTGAYSLLCNISGHIPIVQDERRRWRRFDP